VPGKNKLVHARSDHREHSMIPQQLYQALLKDYPTYYYQVMRTLTALEV
jgi:hypothetical protein